MSAFRQKNKNKWAGLGSKKKERKWGTEREKRLNRFVGFDVEGFEEEWSSNNLEDEGQSLFCHHALKPFSNAGREIGRAARCSFPPHTR